MKSNLESRLAVLEQSLTLKKVVLRAAENRLDAERIRREFKTGTNEELMIVITGIGRTPNEPLRGSA